MDVKNTAMAANIIPSKNESSGISSAQGECTSWKAAAIAKIIVPVISERVAPQNISPAMTSSTFSGVAMIASKVF